MAKDKLQQALDGIDKRLNDGIESLREKYLTVPKLAPEKTLQWRDLKKGQHILVRKPDGSYEKGVIQSKHPVPFMEIHYKDKDGKIQITRVEHIQEVVAEKSPETGEEYRKPENCLICSWEALLNVKTFLTEAVKRKEISKISEAVRETRHASDHLVEEHPDLAREIREFQKAFESCAFKDKLNSCIAEKHFKTVDKLIDRVRERIREEGCEECEVK